MNPLNRALVPICFCLAGLCTAALAQVNVVTYHNDTMRTGANLNETQLTPANVNSNTFGKLFSYSVDGYVFAQPLYVAGVSIAGRARNVLFVATEHNTVYALDADSSANGVLWRTNLGPSAATPNADFGRRYNGGQYLDITPEVGITGTPVIDPATGTLYLDAFTHEGSTYHHRLHALNITNGTERPFSPVLLSASLPGSGAGSISGVQYLTSTQHLQRAAMTLAGGILFATYTGYADTNPYHGWILGFDPVTLQLLTNYMFITTPNSSTTAYGANAGEGGIWMGGNGLAVDAYTNLFFEVGNGIFTATNNSGGTEYSDSFMKLSTTGGLAVADYFTPYNQASLAAGDTDLGSGGLMLLPDQPGPYPHLLVGAGKEGKIYLVNRDQMTTNNTHYNATGSTDPIIQSVPGRLNGSFSTPAYFNGKIYWAANGDKLKSFSVTSGALSTVPTSVGPRTFPFPGSTVSVSANGSTNGVIWTLQMGSPAVLAAYDARNLTNEIYNSAMAGTRDQLANSVKFAVPTVADGKVFVGNQLSVSIFSLFSCTLAFNSSNYTVNEGSGSASITVNRAGGTQGAVQVSYATVPGGTALPGVDYTSTSGTLTWIAGDITPKNFNIPILNDGIPTGNKTVNLALSGPTGSASLGEQSSAVLTIIEEPYDDWRFAHFGLNATNPAVAGDLADPDHDGVVNLLEYALASDPNIADSIGSPAGSIAGHLFQLQFHRNTFATDLTYTIQVATTLGTWSDLMTYTAATGWLANTPGATAVEAPTVGVPPDSYVNVTITDPTDVTSPGTVSHFLRLGVHR